MSEVLSPDKTLDATSTIGVNKARGSFKKLFILAMLAGAFIAFAAQGSTLAAVNLMEDPNTFGLGKVITGLIFTPGIVFVIIAGAELFTGNSLMLVALFDKKITFKELIRAWIIVYLGNLVGSIFVALLVFKSGQLAGDGALIAQRTILTANSKVNLSFSKAVILGILCNWLVCVGIWMSFASTSHVGKILSVALPIMLFVISGFEHSVANMYYIPAGILAKSNPDFVNALIAGHPQMNIDLTNLTWAGFFAKNLLPVTIGNIIGGGFCVAGAYWLSYRGK
ncbi:MAG: formate/nitrite transporter family protein [Tissierellia bacterium]|nr:formate/nitrite transporter family protein [Tissierellia bacterium]